MVINVVSKVIGKAKELFEVAFILWERNLLYPTFLLARELYPLVGDLMANELYMRVAEKDLIRIDFNLMFSDS